MSNQEQFHIKSPLKFEGNYSISTIIIFIIVILAILAGGFYYKEKNTSEQCELKITHEKKLNIYEGIKIGSFRTINEANNWLFHCYSKSGMPSFTINNSNIIKECSFIDFDKATKFCEKSDERKTGANVKYFSCSEILKFDGPD